MKKVIIILITFMLIGCSTDPYEEYDIANKEIANTIFEPFFDQYKKEAVKRGYNFADHEIDFYLADIDGKSAVGIAYSNNQIFIDRDYWHQIDLKLKERLVFHELGHSILKRKHKNQQTEGGECESFMRSKPSDCNQNIYSDLWREYYFDELFDESISLPFWYTSNNKYNMKYENKKFLVKKLDIDSGSYEMNLDTDTISDFVLEVTFTNWSSASQSNPFRNTKINLNGINYETNPNDNAIYISNNEYSKRYFSKWDYGFEEDIKLTIRRNDGIYSFFIGEDYVHVTDIDHPDNKSINVNFSPGTNMDIVLFEFD